MVEGGDKGQCGELRHGEGFEDQGQSEADKNQTDILDRRVSEQAFHVGLHRRKDGAKD